MCIGGFRVTALEAIFYMLDNADLKVLDTNNNSTNSEKGYLSRYIFLIEQSIKDEKKKEILKLRKQGVTLEEIGQRKKITRERVRQIESASIKRIVESINKDANLISYLNLNSDKGFIKVSKIEEIMNSDNDYIFIYSLKNKNVKGLYYIEEYDGFLINGDKKQLEDIMKKLIMLKKLSTM